MLLRWFSWLLLAPITAFAATLGGCDRGPSPPSMAWQGDDPQTRIVSLAPALTQMIVDMGLEQMIVATAENDLAAPLGLPVVGNYQDIHTEALLNVYPTHVLTMTDQRQIPANLRRLAASKRFELVSYPVPLSILDINRIIFNEHTLIPGDSDQDKTPSLGVVLDAPRPALQAAMRMSLQLASVSSVTSDTPQLRVLMVIGVNPLMASGPGTVLNDLLSFCGALNAAGDATVGAPVYDMEKLVHANPDVIVLIQPGGSALGPIDSDPRLATLRGLPIKAVQNNRIVLIDDPLAHLPSSSLGRVGVALAKAVHPELSDDIDRALQASLAVTVVSAHPAPDVEGEAAIPPDTATPRR